MKLRILLVSAFAVLVVAGCGKSDPAASAPAAAAPASGPRTVEITAGDTMKFDITSIDAKPGESLKVVLTNNGTLPKDTMGHNWVLLKKGSDVTAFATAASAAKATDYVPEGLKDQILAHIETLGPRKSGEVAFSAPTEPGEYPFLCSFPGHFVQMKGVLVVK